MSPAFGQDASVERGRVIFEADCTRCHIPVEMNGQLLANRIERTGQELYDQIRQTMPAETLGSLSNPQYLDLTAYILSVGNVEIADEISPADLTALRINPEEAVAIEDDPGNFA